MAKVAFQLADDRTEAANEVRGKKGRVTFTIEATPDGSSLADFGALVVRSDTPRTVYARHLTS